MRFLGIILIIAGAAVAFVYPSYQIGHSGNEVAKVRIFDRDTGVQNSNQWLTHKVRLTSNMAPLRIRLSGKTNKGASIAEQSLNYTIRLQSADDKSTIFSEGLSISIYDSNLDTQGGTRNEMTQTNLFEVSSEFGVIDDNLYEIAIQPGEKARGLTAYLDAIIMSNVEEPSTQFQPLGFAALGLGVVMFILGRRRRKSKKQSAKGSNEPKHNPKHNPKNNQGHKWGRQSKDD